MLLNDTINSCEIDGKNTVYIGLKVLSGFPFWDCSSKPGSFCNENKKIAKLSPVVMKILERIESGTVRIKYATEFDGGRHACVFTEVKVEKV